MLIRYQAIEQTWSVFYFFFFFCCYTSKESYVICLKMQQPLCPSSLTSARLVQTQQSKQIFFHAADDVLSERQSNRSAFSPSLVCCSAAFTAQYYVPASVFFRRFGHSCPSVGRFFSHTILKFWSMTNNLPFLAVNSTQD